MFEVIISDVRSGKVRRDLFPTRSEAETFLAGEELRLMSPAMAGGKARSLRNYRREIAYRDIPAILSMPAARPAIAAAA